MTAAFFLKMVGARRFELPTFRSRTERSTRLSHAPTIGTGAILQDLNPEA